MTIFDLARLPRTELVALYLRTRPSYADISRILPSATTAVGRMTREQLVTAIAGTRAGARLLREQGGRA